MELTFDKEQDQNDEDYLTKLFLELKVWIDSWHKPFGALITFDQNIISIGLNSSKFENDPTCHAEIQAIRLACKELQTRVLTGCTLYTSCEPCLMCLGAIYWAKISRVVYCMTVQEIHNCGFPQFVSNIWEFYSTNWISIESHKWPISAKIKDLILGCNPIK